MLRSRWDTLVHIDSPTRSPNPTHHTLPTHLCAAAPLCNPGTVYVAIQELSEKLTTKLPERKKCPWPGDSEVCNCLLALPEAFANQVDEQDNDGTCAAALHSEFAAPDGTRAFEICVRHNRPPTRHSSLCPSLRPSGTFQMYWKQCTALLGSNSKGWSGEGMTAGPASAKQMLFPFSTLDTTKKLYWFGMAGTKIPDLINHPSYKNWMPDRVQKAGEKWASTSKFSVTRDDISKFAFNTNDVGSMIEGWVRPTTTGECSFFTYRSCVYPTTSSSPCCPCRPCHHFSPSLAVCVSLADTRAPALPRSHLTTTWLPPLVYTQHSDDSSDVWVSETLDKAPAKKGLTDGLKMVDRQATMKKGSSYYIMGRGKEGGGGGYKTFAPDKSEEMAVGTNFKVNRDDIKRQGLYSTNNMGSMIEGWFKVAEDGDCFFFTRRSVRP